MNRLLLRKYYRLILEQEQGVIDLTNHTVKYSKEDKDKQQERIAYQQERLAYQKAEQYIKDGSRGDLDLSNTSITQLPAGLKVGGSLYLIDTPIAQLPAGLVLGGSLDLSRTRIAQLPAGLKVGGSLYLSHNTRIAQLPAGLVVDGNLYLIDTPISKKYTREELKQMLPGVKKSIIF